jgi:tRNA modification GTPase
MEVKNMDTIAAVATALGESGIGIIRLSGDKAIEVVSKIFRHKKGKNLKELKSHKMYYGNIIDENLKLVDEVLVSIMKKPHTYTREDVVEINCHGGRQAIMNILELILKDSENVRIAEPGEFTKRAFLNGRIDLAQAESVIDIIRSQTDSSLRMSMGQLEGRLSHKIEAINEKLLDIQAEIAVDVDYPEYEDEQKTSINSENALIDVKKEINDLLKSAKTGRIIKEGIKTVIVGRPNVGKSSLLNMLLGEERAIVTEIPGTTRDTVEEQLNLGGIPLHIIDTAGIREADDPIEKIGVERSKKALSSADLILLVLDSSQELNEDDTALLNSIPKDRSIAVLNKTDLNPKININEMETSIPVVLVSALKSEGVDKLEEVVKERFVSGDFDVVNDVIVSNVRHITLLREANNLLDQALETIGMSLPIDLINIDIENCRQKLGQIVGKSVEEDLLNHIFNNFCLGK